jgi:hypothetical protein
LRKPVTVAAVARDIADCLNLRRTERSAQRNVA